MAYGKLLFGMPFGTRAARPRAACSLKFPNRTRAGPPNTGWALLQKGP